MRNKKGFTLLELLAIIVLLGLISMVPITALMNNRKNANKKLAKEMEQSLTKLGEEIYVYETMNGSDDSGSFNDKYKSLGDGKIIITLNQLKDAGYLKNLVKDGSDYKFVSPESKNKKCEGYLIIKIGPESQGYIRCDNNLYETTSYDSEKHDAVGVTLTNN